MTLKGRTAVAKHAHDRYQREQLNNKTLPPVMLIAFAHSSRGKPIIVALAAVLREAENVEVSRDIFKPDAKAFQ